MAQVWSPGASVAACQHFIGQREFKEILFKNGLPWVFVFDGLRKKVGDERTGPADPDDGTVVVTGDLSASYDKNRTLFRSVAVAKDARLELPAEGGKFILYDFYANPLPAESGKIVVPLNQLGYFLRTDGTRGSFDKLMKAIRKAKIIGIDPVEIVARDMTAPIGARPKLNLKISDVLDRPVRGKLLVKIDGLVVDPEEQTLSLQGQESREAFVTITGGDAQLAWHVLPVQFHQRQRLPESDPGVCYAGRRHGIGGAPLGGSGKEEAAGGSHRNRPDPGGANDWPGGDHGRGADSSEPSGSEWGGLSSGGSDARTAPRQAAVAAADSANHADHAR
ncbi:MAG TPA: hypothetical protein VFE51_29465 [Verrucomicrobiae bacterium]|nr:hypothetical protein [Verrucomicrobiae bacterium]